MPIMSHASAGEASVGSAELTEPAEFLECCMHCYMGYEEPACSDWHGTAQVRPGQQTPACCRLLQTSGHDFWSWLLCLLFSHFNLSGSKLGKYSTGEAAIKCMFINSAYLGAPLLVEPPCHDKKVVAPVTVLAGWILIQLPV